MLVLLTFLAGCGGDPPAAAAERPFTEAATAPVSAGSREDTDISGLERAMANGAFVVDVRTDGEWAQGHVPGANHLPLSDLTADHALLASHDKSVPVYFVCESGGRSGRAADAMMAAGFKTVNVKGGTGAWRSAGKPLEMP